MQEIELKDIADDLLIVNKTTIERLFNEETQNPLILYLFYYKTAKWQQCNPIKATDEYCKKCLHWGIDRIQATKRRLKEMELIQTIRKTNDKGKVEGWYIKVNYLINNSRIPETTIPSRPQLVSQETNTINNKYINTNNNKNTKKEFFDKEELNDLFNEFLDFRKKLKAVNSDKAITLLINKLNEYDDETKMKMINQSIENSWKSVFPLKKEYKRKENGFELLERLKREELEKQNAKK